MSGAALLCPPEAPAADAARWDRELRKCARDAAYFLDRWGVIDKPKRPAAGEETAADELGDAATTEAGTVPFRLWPAQVGVMGILATERLVVILKARQLGISWLVCGYVLWLCLFHPHQAIFLFSRRQADANELVRRIKALYARLPAGLRDRLPTVADKDNVREVAWSNASRIQSMPDTKDSGVGNTASLVVLDEWARMRWGGELFESVKPVMEAGGQLVILTNARGFNWMHDLWDKAVKRLNSFQTVFLPWWARPGRTWAWYRQVVRDSSDPDKVKENYPANAIEAFRASGRLRFQADWIEAQASNLREPLPPHRWPGALRGVPGLRVYAEPLPDVEYIVPADVAEGKETSNYDAAVVLRKDTWEEVAFLHGRWEPDVFALWLIALGTAYNVATLVPERNNHGHATLATLKFKQYPRERVGLGRDGYPGWLTGQAKDKDVDFLAEALRCRLVKVRSQAALNEFAVYKRLKNGSTGAECFVPGTMILGSSCIPVSIDRVQSNDSVMTHKGRERIVKSVKAREYDGEVVAIKASGVPFEIVATPEHPFWARERTTRLCRRSQRREFPPSWIDAGDLKPGDWVAVPKRVGLPPTDLSPERLYAIGFWLAEGNLIRDKPGGYKGIALTNTRTDLIGPVSDTFAEWFPLNRVFWANKYRKARELEKASHARMGIERRPAGKTIYRWQYQCRPAADYLAGHFGYRSDDKKVSDELFGCSGLLPLACGFIDGEGHQRIGGDRDVTFATVSDSLAWQMRQILIDNGVWCTIRHSTSQRPIWSLNIKASFLGKLGMCRIVEPVDIPVCRHVIEDDGYFYTAVRRIERRPYKGPVHNIEVDGDNSYVAGGVAVHNCPYFDDVTMTWVVGLAYLRHLASLPRPAPPVVGGPPSRPTGFPAVPAPLGFPGAGTPRMPGFP